MKPTDEFNKLSEEQQHQMLIDISKRLINERKWNEYFIFLNSLCSHNILL